MNRSISKFILRLVEKLKNGRDHIMDKVYENEFPYKFAQYGENVHIYYPCYISGAKFLKIGNNVHINRGGLIRAEGGLKIGSNAHIGRNVTIYTINHNYKGKALPYDHTIIMKPVIIKKNVWIGINATITPGVTIGEGAVIGAGTTVACDIPPFAIVGTPKLRIIKYRDREHYMNLIKMGNYGGVNGELFRSKKK